MTRDIPDDKIYRMSNLTEYEAMKFSMAMKDAHVSHLSSGRDIKECITESLSKFDLVEVQEKVKARGGLKFTLKGDPILGDED